MYSGDFMSNEKANDASDGSSKAVKGDIVRIEFDGYTEDSKELFDTTSAQVAKDNGVFNEKATYTSVPVLIGGGRIFQGLDEALDGVEIGKEIDVVIPSDKAAGARDPKLVELLPLREFLRQDIEPRIGLEVNIKNRLGIVSAVTAGRVRVDFNRPLAGKSLLYHFKVISKYENDEEKAKAIVEMDYGTSEGFNVTVEDKTVSMVLPDVCKYDQKWLLAKYRIVADLREALKANNVRFIEEYLKKEETEAKSEATPEEIAPEELPETEEESEPVSSRSSVKKH